MAVRRVAVFGGTFDPFHLGHLAVALQAREGILAGETWIVPAGTPPHRGPVEAAAADRLEMCRLGIGDRPGLRVLDLEILRPGPAFTVDTMRDLTIANPGVGLWVVLGADAARQIGTWHRSSELLAGYHFVLVNRTGEASIRHDEAIRLGFHPERTRVLGIDSPDVSASEIRRRVRAGESLDGLVSAAVAALIARRGLYR
ncbi:MAG: nicotinate (nicotinamide) nucleotide adenylyltransferase [Candidatus Dormibacteria bacterium]|jgi:nicotinate-nucleotide adenylyltransferase